MESMGDAPQNRPAIKISEDASTKLCIWPVLAFRERNGVQIVLANNLCLDRNIVPVPHPGITAKTFVVAEARLTSERIAKCRSSN